MVKVNSWWKSPIWAVDTGYDSKFNEELLDEIYSIAKNIQTGIDRSPKDDLWDYDLPHLQQLKKRIHELIVASANDYVHEAREVEGLQIQFEFLFGWVNVKEPGQRIEMHAHSDAALAATYYIKVPENSGDISFIDTGELVVVDGEYTTKNPTAKIKTITPKVGQLVFFPAYLMHEVQENKSNDLRISLSTDMKLKIEKDSPNAVVLKSWVNDLVKIKEYVPKVK
jgi:uncharacterized protein (TIGR02466 family)